MLNTLIAILFFIFLLVWAGGTFILANVVKEDTMDTKIEVKPNKDGKYIVVLYGHTIELVPVKPTVSKKAEK